MIIDQYHGDPTYAQLHVLTRNRPLAREMIKQASFETTEVENLPSSAFAWEAERRFPTYTKADTVASILYRTKCAFVPECVDQRLADAAKIYDLDMTLVAGEKVAGEQQEPSTFVFPEEERLPLNTPAQIKIAEHVLTRDFERLPIEKRADAFVKLAAAAEAQDVELTPLARKLAGLTICSRDKLINWVEARATASESPCREIFDKLATDLRRADEHIDTRKDLIKLASTIHTLDEKAGLTKHYDRKLPDALQTVFNTEKTAEPTCDVAGKRVACSQLMNLPNQVWDDVDVPELAKIAEVTEFKQIFDTLPIDLKIALKAYV